jgi:hypothetical protein
LGRFTCIVIKKLLGQGTGELRGDKWRSHGVSFHRMGIMVRAHQITVSLFISRFTLKHQSMISPLVLLKLELDYHESNMSTTLPLELTSVFMLPCSNIRLFYTCLYLLDERSIAVFSDAPRERLLWGLDAKLAKASDSAS